MTLATVRYFPTQPRRRRCPRCHRSTPPLSGCALCCPERIKASNPAVPTLPDNYTPVPVPAPARVTTPTLIDVSRRSSFISSFAYQGTTDGAGYLAIFFKAGHAALYRVPPTIPGLLASGHTNSKAHKVLSVGATYNRLIKGVYEGESISDPEKVRELLKLMGGK